ncbi:hypothetical protein FB451DRAFT_1415107 [Mycena latifolia]|nr:hypothetical protein FB451DRAFT_1415107 [Mycena latifolia]
MTTAKRDFRVAIIGGGMCGLACAVGLRKRGIDAQVFEAADECAQGLEGARAAGDCVGLVDASDRDVDREMIFVSGSGTHEPVHTYAKDTGFRESRPAFLAVVVPLVDSSAVHFNKRLTHLSASASVGGHVLHFSDGTTHEADVLIGADGIKSVVRSAVVDPREKPLQFTNSVAYRATVSVETLRQAGVKTKLDKDNYCFVGIDKHLVYFPIDFGRCINVVAFVTDTSVPAGSVEITGPWAESASQQEVLDAYAGWGADVLTILQHLNAPSKWYIHALRPLSTFVKSRIALVGDSAHTMPPHLGAGVGRGFEDVLVLCELLAHPATKLSNVEDVFKAYDAIRRPRANMVLERSIQAGKIYEAYGTPGYAAAAEMTGRLAEIFEPIWTHDLDADLASAVRILRAAGHF